MSDLNQSLMDAAKQGDVEVAGCPLAAGAEVHAADDCALRWAALSGHIQVVERLLAAGADVHANDDCALQWAARNGHTQVVERLLAAGADVHADDDYALRWAAENGYTQVVERLLAAGAPENHPCLAKAAKAQPAVQAWLEARQLQQWVDDVAEAAAPGRVIAPRKIL